MPVAVKFDPNSTSVQTDIIPDATPFNDGVMTKEQVAQLAAVEGSAQIIVVDSSQFDGNDNFDVVLATPFTGDYDVQITPYVTAANGPMTFTIQPRPGDPTPPALKASDGFRLNSGAPFTGYVRIKCSQ